MATCKNGHLLRAYKTVEEVACAECANVFPVESILSGCWRCVYSICGECRARWNACSCRICILRSRFRKRTHWRLITIFIKKKKNWKWLSLGKVISWRPFWWMVSSCASWACRERNRHCGICISYCMFFGQPFVQNSLNAFVELNILSLTPFKPFSEPVVSASERVAVRRPRVKSLTNSQNAIGNGNGDESTEIGVNHDLLSTSNRVSPIRSTMLIRGPVPADARVNGVMMSLLFSFFSNVGNGKLSFWKLPWQLRWLMKKIKNFMLDICS